jgi:hypothetical protein
MAHNGLQKREWSAWRLGFLSAIVNTVGYWGIFEIEKKDNPKFLKGCPNFLYNFLVVYYR